MSGSEQTMGGLVTRAAHNDAAGPSEGTAIDACSIAGVVAPKIAISRTPESVEVSRDEPLAKMHANSLAY
jgi:hypothetical protein